MAKTQAPPMPKPSNSQASKKATKPTAQKTAPVQQVFLFNKENYMILGAGLVLIVIGYLLMVGGQQAPDKWDPNVIYSFRRITLSTIFVLVGFIVIIFSIFWKGKSVKG